LLLELRNYTFEPSTRINLTMNGKQQYTKRSCAKTFIIIIYMEVYYENIMAFTPNELQSLCVSASTTRYHDVWPRSSRQSSLSSCLRKILAALLSSYFKPCYCGFQHCWLQHLDTSSSAALSTNFSARLKIGHRHVN